MLRAQRLSIRLSVDVCLPVMSVGCDHIKLAHHRIVHCLVYLHAEVDPDRNIASHRILPRKTIWMWKM